MLVHRRGNNPEVVPHNDLMVARACLPLLAERGLDSLDALFAVPNDRALAKPGLPAWRERIRLELHAAGSAKALFLKRFTDPPLRVVREATRRTAGARTLAGAEWTWLCRLREFGIPGPRPVAWGESVRQNREARSAVVMLGVPGDSLERWVSQWGSGARRHARSVLRPLADLVRRLHHEGFAHRDLYLSHVFHDPAGNPSRSLSLIDVQRMIRRTPLARRWVVKDLAALHYSTPADAGSRTDRMRWLLHYLGEERVDATTKRLIYRIEGRARRMAQHDARRRARTSMEPEPE